MTKRFLVEHKDVCILESDKGKRMVIMYQKDYDQKMLNLLDNPTYKVLSKDPTSTIQRKNNTIATRLLNLKIIDRSTSNHLQTYTAVCPRIYGQPKAHKPTLPLRPVVPNITAPTYHLSKYVATILKQATHSTYNITDIFEFVEFINAVTLPPDYVLVSFDVVSLFTNIPKDLVIQDLIMQWDKVKVVTDINLDMFLEIVEFCIDSSYFCFRDKFYLQTFGTAMGSPLSPILAELVMENLISTVTKNLPFAVPVLKKYVDDLLLALPKDKIQFTLDRFNSYNEHLQFTIEEETNNRIPFLDTLVIRNPDQSIQTQWYSKPIASGRLLNFHSFHPTTMKINVAANFVKRVSSLTTNQTIQQQKHKIFQHLRQNNYPAALINRLINSIHNQNTTTSPKRLPPNSIPSQPSIQANHQHQISQPQLHPCPTSSITLSPPNHQNTIHRVNPPSNQTVHQISPTQPPIYRAMPHIPVLSTVLANILKTDFSNVKIAYTTIKTTKNVLRQVKDPIDPQQQSNVIYSIPCGNCQMTYIGMTRNQLKTRLSGHRSNTNKYKSLVESGNTNTDQQIAIAQLAEKTALIQHTIEHGHNFDLPQTKIIDRTYRTSALPILEMCHITNTSNTVNHRTDVDGLNATYAGILHTIKTKTTRRNKPKNDNHTNFALQNNFGSL